MKIGFSSFVLDKGKSGISTYIQHLLPALAAIDDRNFYDVFVLKNEAELIPHLNSNFNIYKEPNFLSNPIINIMWHNSLFQYLAKKNHLDLIHIPSIRRIPYIKGCKIIATIHDFAPLVIAKKYDKWRQFYHRHILSRCVHRCDHIIAISETTKKDLITYTQYEENRVTVIYSGIDRNVFHAGPKDFAQNSLKQKYLIETPYFVYVSRIEYPAKNHLRLIQAFEQFKQKNHTPHQLVFAGADWPGAEIVKDYVQKSPFKKDILFLGFVPTEDVPLLYQGCDLMIFPSLYEGFGFPVLEALACGAKVICSSIPSLIEIASNYAGMFNPYRIDAILKAMEDGLVQTHHSTEIQKQIAYTLTFDWNKTARQVLKVYERVASLS